MIPKRDKTTDISTEIAQGKFFQKRIKQAAEEVAGRFMSGENLNDAMADIAKRENFNQVQIQRLVEEGNTVAFNKKYNDVKKDSDRRITFELGELSFILDRMGSEAPPAIDNPNLAKGKAGEGEMKKVASTQQSIITPNSHVQASREKLLAKQAAEKTAALTKEAATLNRSIESGIFKVAQSIVRSEQMHKNANELFNTVLSETGFDDFLVDGIMKKAQEITNRMKETGRAHSGFVLSLEVKPEEKVASTLFGSRSLVKSASVELVKEPKVAPIQDVGDYQQLISLAKEIQRKQEQSLATEKQLHGGANNV